MTDFNDLVDRYVAAWNETDADRRVKAVAELWTEDGTYTDPLADVRGHEAIASIIAAVQAQFPGFAFKPGTLVDGHHNTARFTWQLAPKGAAESVVDGFDVVVLAEDGRIKHVHGFLDKVPAA